MIAERVHLGELTIGHATGEPEPLLHRVDFTNLEEYGRFKYGDGQAALKYGRMLGQTVVGRHSEVFMGDDVYVASSAYRFAPPASQGLVSPFVESARAAISNSGLEVTLKTFSIGKSRLATDGYSEMTFEERRATLQSDLILPDDIDFKDRSVVMLDDIRVTGLREEALQGLFGHAGAAETIFGYVLNVENGPDFPKIEGILNRTAVKNIDDIIGLASRPGFIPNVRTCKFIAARSSEEIDRFCSRAPAEVVKIVLSFIEKEDLENIVKIVP